MSLHQSMPILSMHVPWHTCHSKHLRRWSVCYFSLEENQALIISSIPWGKNTQFVHCFADEAIDRLQLSVEPYIDHQNGNREINPMEKVVCSGSCSINSDKVMFHSPLEVHVVFIFGIPKCIRKGSQYYIIDGIKPTLKSFCVMCYQMFFSN